MDQWVSVWSEFRCEAFDFRCGAYGSRCDTCACTKCQTLELVPVTVTALHSYLTRLLCFANNLQCIAFTKLIHSIFAMCRSGDEDCGYTDWFTRGRRLGWLLGVVHHGSLNRVGTCLYSMITDANHWFCFKSQTLFDRAVRFDILSACVWMYMKVSLKSAWQEHVTCYNRLVCQSVWFRSFRPRTTVALKLEQTWTLLGQSVLVDTLENEKYTQPWEYYMSGR